MDIEKYSTDSLQAITDASFLVENDWKELAVMQEELQDTYEKQKLWRTETEMRVSVLNDVKHPTNASKYWQAVKEQAVFFEQLVMLSFDYRRNNIEIMKKERELQDTTDELDKMSLQVDLDECFYKKKNMQLSAKDRMRELKLWSKIKAELNDGSFDTQDVNSHQLESYNLAFQNELQIAIESGNASPAEARNILGRATTAKKELEKHKAIEYQKNKELQE